MLHRRTWQEMLLMILTLCLLFCYLASHFGLGLISEECIQEVMAFLEENKAR
jgi:hypothetical protein